MRKQHQEFFHVNTNFKENLCKVNWVQRQFDNRNKLLLVHNIGKAWMSTNLLEFSERSKLEQLQVKEFIVLKRAEDDAYHQKMCKQTHK